MNEDIYVIFQVRSMETSVWTVLFPNFQSLCQSGSLPFSFDPVPDTSEQLVYKNKIANCIRFIL